MFLYTSSIMRLATITDTGEPIAVPCIEETSMVNRTLVNIVFLEQTNWSVTMKCCQKTSSD